MPPPTNFSLNSTERQLRQQLIGRSQQTFGRISDLIAEADATAARYQRQIQDLLIELNSSIANQLGFARATAKSFRHQFNSFPTSYRDSPEGQTIHDFICTWEDFNPWTQHEMAFPEPLEPPDDGDINWFASLPHEP